MPMSAAASLNAGPASGAVTVRFVSLSAHAASAVQRAMRLVNLTFDIIRLRVMGGNAVRPAALDTDRHGARGGVRWTFTCRGGARVRFITDPPRHQCSDYFVT